MRKAAIFFAALIPCLWIACSSDDDDNGPVDDRVRVTAYQTSTEPSLQDVNDDLWDSTDAKNITLDQVGGMAQAVPTSIEIEAIKTDDKLYLRFVWEDTSLNQWLQPWRCGDPAAGNFSRPPNPYGDGEDQLLVMFQRSSGGYDVWNWKALKTALVDLAEGKTYSESEWTLDAGTSPIAFENFGGDPARPRYFHTTGAPFQEPVLYLDQTTTSWADVRLTGWQEEDLVAGWVIDSTMGRNVREAQTESRWDILSAWEYDAELDQHTVVLCRKLNTTYEDDLDLSTLEQITVRVGVLDDLPEPLMQSVGNREKFSGEFLIILQ